MCVNCLRILAQKQDMGRVLRLPCIFKKATNRKSTSENSHCFEEGSNLILTFILLIINSRNLEYWVKEI
jgi:hypothetical protein